jgi:hypothetical protein
MKRTVLLTLAVLFTLMTTGYASEKKHHDMPMPDPTAFDAHFGDMDSDGDGSVSAEEFAAYFPDADQTVFAALDMNQDGGVDHDEWHAFKEAHGMTSHE